MAACIHCSANNSELNIKKPTLNQKSSYTPKDPEALGGAVNQPPEQDGAE